MPVVRAANAEPWPGYRLLEPLGRGGFGEVWKCQAPGGFLKAVKFVGHSVAAEPAREPAERRAVHQEIRALQLLKTIRHPFLLSVERVDLVDGELLILTELADCSLRDLLINHQRQGLSGIPRNELLEYLREAAEVLDLMNQEHGLQHLDIKPHNLFVLGGHCKVGDFGLVGSLADLFASEGSPGPLDMISPFYAAPERFTGKATAFSDQYSLAITYVELLTGQLPFRGSNYRALARQHLQEEPDLNAVPEDDRPAVRKALAKDARQRFPSCAVFVASLLNPGVEGTRVTRRVSNPLPVEVPTKPPTRPDIDLGNLASTDVMPPRNTEVERPTPAPQVPEPVPVPSTPLGTRVVPSLQVPAPTAPSTLLPTSVDPLAGWEFLDCLARMPFGEFWHVRNRQREDKLVKLVFGYDPKPDSRGRDPLARLAQLVHPRLVPIEAIPTPGRLVLVSPFHERTLTQRLEEAQKTNQSGIPREELLGYLGEIATLLDEFRSKHSILHLGLNPDQLVLDDEGIQLADLGLVELIWQPAGQNAATLNTRYASPELFNGQPTRGSDQYSLALIFTELLTGAHPFRNLNQRQMATVKTRGAPDLSMTPARDRPVLATALAQDPRERFRTCRELIDALIEVSPSQRVRGTGRQAIVPLPPLMRRPALNRVLRQLTEQASGELQVREFGQQRFLLHPGVKITHHCFARLVASTLVLKLEGFREQWKAKVIRQEETRYVFQIRFPASMLDRLLGRQPGLEISIVLDEGGATATAALASVLIEMQPISSNSSRSADLLEEMGPVLLESLRNHLQAAPERRKQQRFTFSHPVTIYPLLEDDELGKGISGQTHDVSLSGLGVYLPHLPPDPDVAVHLRGPDPQGVLLAGRIVRQGQCKDGRHDLGILFDEPLTS